MIFHRILAEAPEPPIKLNPGLPPKLEEVINKALEKDRELRCQTAAELRADLKRLKRDTDSGRSAGVRSASVSPALHPTSALRRWPVPLAAAVLVLAAGAAVALSIFCFFCLERNERLRRSEHTKPGFCYKASIFCSRSSAVRCSPPWRRPSSGGLPLASSGRRRQRESHELAQITSSDVGNTRRPQCEHPGVYEQSRNVI